jgi:hypothetical protein
VHHCITRLGGGNVFGLLLGSGVGTKTPAAGCSRELWPVGAHGEAEGGRVVEGQGWGTGWCWTSVHGAWEDGLVHVAHVAVHYVRACHRTLVVLTWASTCCADVVVVDVTAMFKTVVPVLVLFNW